jgi:hypothetical protein
MEYIRKTGVLILLAVCLALLFFARERTSKEYDSWRKVRRQEKPGEFQGTRASSLGVVEFLATGAKPLIADLYWIQATTQNSDEVFELSKSRAASGKGIGSVLTLEADVARTPKDNRDLYDLISNAIYLDPRFEYAYYYGGNILAWDGELTLATDLLQKGLKSNLRSGMLASSLSFIYYYFYKDWDSGAYYARMSYKYSGKYSSTPKNVAALYAAGRHFDLAISFLADALQNTKDPTTKKQLEEQMKYLFVEKYIEFLDKSLDRYKQMTGSYPASLDTLIKSGLISSVPKDPFGGRFVITGPGKVENRPYNRFEHFANVKSYIEETPNSGRNFLQ